VLRRRERSTDFDHLEVFFADTAFGTHEIVGHFVPRRAGRDAFVLVSFGLIVDPAANDTLPFPHLRSLSPVQFRGAVRYLRHRENANEQAAADHVLRGLRRVARLVRRGRKPLNSRSSNRVTRVTRLTGRLPLYMRLMRFDRPVGTLLLLWPTLAALWIAAAGRPPLQLIVVFVLGTIVMRAAGCVINDYADRNLDAHVARTRERPLATKQVSETEALLLFAVLLAIALILVFFLDRQTQWLAVGGAGIATLYPFMKRWTYLPQVVLGAAFSWGIVMAFSAAGSGVHAGAWLLFIASVLWIVAYDTIYAMVDREDDLRVGIKSTAILFGNADRVMIAALQTSTIVTLVLLGLQLHYGIGYFGAIAVGAGLFVHQQRLIRKRNPADCFAAFRNNVWVGFALFAGTLIELEFRSSLISVWGT